MTIIQNDQFQRPASYWLRRAERCRQGGDPVRAAVLERHAVRAERESDTAAMSYVLTLRRLSCYEASNREAFSALAADPGRKELYGLVGQNMLAMGQRGAGQDALNIYLADPLPQILPEWHDDAYDLACSCDDLPVRRRKARFDGLLAMAGRYIALGELLKARRALERASRTPYQGASAQRDLLWALYHLRNGNQGHSLAFLQNALRLRPRNAQLLSSAAGLYLALGKRQAAYHALMRAAHFAFIPSDELAVLLACDQLRAPHIALGMLRRAHKHQPYRYPVLYNLCVCLLRLGRLGEAVQHIHLCREIDPDDVPGEVLFSRVMDMQEANVTPSQIRRFAQTVSWYGAATQEELNACVAPILAQLADGPEALASAILADSRLRQRFLHLLGMPADWPAKLLAAVGMAMPEKERDALMREVLLRHPQPSAAKGCAVQLLHDMQSPPPYAAWQNGRIGWIDPTLPPQKSPTFRQRYLTLRIRKAQRLCPGDGTIALWAMELVHRMTLAQRSRLIADHVRVWPIALAVRYRALRGLEPVRIDISRFGRARLGELNRALRVLRSLS